MAPSNDSEVVIHFAGEISKLKASLAQSKKLIVADMKATQKKINSIMTKSDGTPRLRFDPKQKKEIADANQSLINSQNKLNNAELVGAKELGGLNEQYKEAKKTSSDANKETIKVSKSLAGIKESLPTKDFKRFQSNMEDVNKEYDNSYTGTEKLQLGLKRTQKQLKAMTKPFAGWAMSLMFAGMALKRLFDTIWKFGSKTFNEVMHSTEGTVTEFDRLGSSLSYIGYMVGLALEPVVAYLVPIIWSIGDWIGQNQKLVSTVLIIIGALGTLLMNFGMIKLATRGFGDALSLLSGGKLTSLLGLITTPVGLGILALIALGALAWTSLLKTPAAWESIKDSLSLLKEPLKDIYDAFESLVLTLFPDMDSALEAVAWYFAWLIHGIVLGVKLGIEVIGLFVTGFKGIVDGMILVTSVAKAMWKMIASGFSDTSGFAKVKEDFNTLIDDMKDQFNNIKDIASTGVEIAVHSIGGPSAFKKTQEYKQEMDSSIEDSGGFTNWLGNGGLQSSGNQSNQYINIEKVEIVVPEGQSIDPSLLQDVFYSI